MIYLYIVCSILETSSHTHTRAASAPDKHMTQLVISPMSCMDLCSKIMAMMAIANIFPWLAVDYGTSGLQIWNIFLWWLVGSCTYWPTAVVATPYISNLLLRRALSLTFPLDYPAAPSACDSVGTERLMAPDAWWWPSSGHRHRFRWSTIPLSQIGDLPAPGELSWDGYDQVWAFNQVV